MVTGRWPARLLTYHDLCGVLESACKHLIGHADGRVCRCRGLRGIRAADVAIVRGIENDDSGCLRSGGQNDATRYSISERASMQVRLLPLDVPHVP